MPQDQTAPENVQPVDITLLGKGCIPTPPEVKAQLYAIAAPEVVAATDWDVPYRVPVTLIQKHQNGSSSCTAQATNYYVEAIDQIQDRNFERFSSRFIYSQVYAPGGGAYIWKAMSIPITQGVADFFSVPGGTEPEAVMRDSSANVKAVLKTKAQKYAQLPATGKGIDYLASVVRDYKGFVTGFNGWNGMFDSRGQVINWSKNDWGHAVYVCGYEKRNGIKCLRFRNSWGAAWGDNGDGYMPEAFLSSGMTFDAFVYASVADLDPTTVETLTRKRVMQLQALEGYYDEDGIAYWSGEKDGVKKVESDFFKARIPDKIGVLQAALTFAEAPASAVPPPVPPAPEPAPQPPVVVK